MNVSLPTFDKIREALSLLTIHEPETFDKEARISHVYVGDLLSRAMSRVTSGDLWITIMNNRNVIAVAELSDAAAVILAEGVELMPDAREAAEKSGIAVYSSPLSVYEICRAIAELTL